MKKFIASLLVLMTTSGAFAQESKPLPDNILGSEDAPITLIEFAAPTCPHCAEFHKEVLPQIKKNLVETGRVKFIFREFPLNRLGLQAAVLARCLPEKRYHAFWNIIFKKQADWRNAEGNPEKLITYARQSGLSKEEAEACLQNEEIASKIIAARIEATNTYNIKSTPSVVINGKNLDKRLTYENILKAVEDLE